MKIVKSLDNILDSDKRRMIANMFCDKCPTCGEERPIGITDSFKQFGILNGLYKSYCKGIFRIKHMKIDCYHCLTCGTEWESEPYEE